ncbi:MAG: amidophosphoribosyltransferase [Candidatus Anoxymicrobium japonicum]|uniref:Amidophosphoribosyltransferase n=1 Tax=Candidatus Anoxymicrobium japonicum TaxID=2013648 RepID=A0A2N3G6N8_9ACTN|nr:MAG: amidophosphoribosyltransferase [Candidatus Anoxymicrobium japonicum]
MDSDSPEEECGVFGVWAPGEEVARVTYFGLYALQHRGQESAGIAVTSGDGILVVKDMGLVSQVFNENSFVSLTGNSAIGHVRYSTTGSSYWENAQPMYDITDRGPHAIAHNGNLLNTESLREWLCTRGATFTSTTDTEIMSSLLGYSSAATTIEAIAGTFPMLQGAYSAVILTEEGLFGVRDPYGIRPLCLGARNGATFIASETAALDVVGAKFIREIEPGEIVQVNENGVTSRRFADAARPSLCIFEFIYFARPDSLLYDRVLYDARKEMGMHLAEEAPIEADIVIPVPDSGVPAAIGFAEKSGVPFGEGLIKNRYIGRTFIQPTQAIRQLGVRLKLNPLTQVIAGKRLVVVDDSIVRGTTSQKIVEMLKEAGAAEIHIRVSSPPISYPCFYGIDTAVRNELIASKFNVRKIREFLGVDSLHYLSMKNLLKACGNARDKFCTACFDGVYPMKAPEDFKSSKFRLKEKTSAQKEVGRSAGGY